MTVASEHSGNPSRLVFSPQVIAAVAAVASAASWQARTLHTAKVAEAKTAEFPLLTSQTYGVPASTFLLKESPIQMKTVAYAAPAGVSVESTPIELKSIKVDEQSAKFKSNKHVGGVLVHQAAVVGYPAGWAAAPVEYTVPASIAEGEIEWKADKVANYQHAPLTYAAQAYAAPAVAASLAYTVPAAAVKTFDVELKADKMAAIQAAPVAYAAQAYAAPAVAAHVAYAAPASIAVKKMEVDLKAEKVAEVKAAPVALAAHAYAVPAVAVQAAAPVAYPAAASVGFSVPAPAVTYTAAHPAVIRQEVEVPVTKTVHYADEQVITGYSSSIFLSE